MSYPAFCRSRPIKTGRLIAPIICFLPALLLLLAVPFAGAQTLPLPTHAAGFYTAGSVHAVAVDAKGRFYIGGSFSFVNGVPRSNLARFNADGTLDTAWNPNPDGYEVSVLAIAGDTVYAGGHFTAIGGQARNNLAALDAGTGAATAWNPNPDRGVSALAVAGDTVYVAGGFTAIGGQARNHLAALDAGTGVATAWNPNPDGGVSVLAVSGDTVYVGGYFNTIGGQARNRLAALDATTGAATAWNPNPDGEVSVLAVSGDTVYAGGYFHTISGQARNGIAALDAGTGAATAWNPNTDGVGVSDLAVAGDTVYVAGGFTAIGGQARNYLAALDATTGAATAWNPNPDSPIDALAASGGTVYTGGYFTTIGGATHLGAAAIATTGEVSATPYDAQIPGNVLAVAVDGSRRVVVVGDFLQAGSLNRSYLARFRIDGTLDTAWNPNPDGGVLALAVSGDTVYVGGFFTTIGGQVRKGIAALDAGTGAATAWNPNSEYGVFALAVAGDTVYAGGSFTAIGGQTRFNLAALDATTGAATAWNPKPDGRVSALAVSGDTVYAGGLFGSIGGQKRSLIAALDAATGVATAWNPNAEGATCPPPCRFPPPLALAVSGNTVYVAGDFTTIGGQARSSLAALDATTGAATAWNPNPGYGVMALAVSGDTVYVGGGFTAIGGQARNNIAALDATTGAATAWNPNPDIGTYGVLALAVSGNTVYAGGGFAQISGVPRAGFAALPANGTPSPTLTALTSSANPALFGQAITFTATVTGQNPTGAVAFTADGWIGCRAAALISGSARCVAGLSVGSHAIGAAYGGDAGNRPSTATPLTQTVRNAFVGASPSGQGDVGAEFSGGGENCHLTQAALVDPPAAPPPGYSFPHGLLRFTLDGACTGPVTVRVTYPAALPAGATFWKYGRTAADPTPHWYTLPAALAGASATFALTDGGLGDDDLAVNGSITDDGGVGVPITEIPTLTEWLALLLAALLLGFGGWRLRQNRSL